MTREELYELIRNMPDENPHLGHIINVFHVSGQKAHCELYLSARQNLMGCFEQFPDECFPFRETDWIVSRVLRIGYNDESPDLD